MKESVKQILSSLGEDVAREGLLKTPARYAKFIQQFTREKQLDFNFTVFDSEGYDQMITVTSYFYSLCEHHLVPFFGMAYISYIPDKHIAGISKLPRTVDFFAGRLQNQERLTQQIADFLFKKLNPRGVGVRLEARHLCMEMRGVRKNNGYTKTTSLQGVYQNLEVKEEFLNECK